MRSAASDGASRGAPVWLLLALVAALLLGGCMPAGPLAPPAAPPPPPLARTELETLAALLRLQDERRWDEPALRAAAAADDPRVRRQAALAMGRLREPAGVEPLARLLLDPDTAVASAAAFALGQIGDERALPALAARLREDTAAARATVAAEAAYALGKLQGGAPRDSLIRLLAEPPLNAAAVEPVGSALLAVWRHAQPPDLDPVARWLAAPDAELRWRAAYALARRPSAAAAPLLFPALVDPDARVRALALRGLARAAADSAGLGVDSVAGAAAAMLGDPDYTVRIAAARALAGYADVPAAVEALQTALGSDESHLALAAAESLGRAGATAAAAAGDLSGLALADSAEVALRAAALEALAAVRPDAGQALAERLARSPEWRLRAAAARALLTRGLAAVPAAEPLLRDRDPRVANAALRAAVESAAAADSPEALRARLIEALGARDPLVRATAASALGTLGDPALLPLLLDAYARALGDEQNDARLAAVDALAALRRAGVEPGRAFFARFPRSGDALVRQRAVALGPTARAWGEPLPLDPVRSPAEYHRIARELLAPALAGAEPPRVRIQTELGPLDLRLFAADAPLTVLNFLELARAGYFDGQHWPRVVPAFVVQGGDPRGDTDGGPGHAIRDEPSPHRYGTGTLGMALAGADTGGSQWFITHAPQPHLDGAYTVFGELLAGQEVARRLLPGHRILRVHPIQPPETDDR